MPGIKITGDPNNPDTGRPGGAGVPPGGLPPGGDTGTSMVPWSGSSISGFDQHNHIRNQQITAAGVAGNMGGGGGGGLSPFFGYPNSSSGGNNPMNQGGGSAQFGSANYWLRQIANTDLLIAGNTGRGGGGGGGAGFGGGGNYPGFNGRGGFYPGNAFTGGFYPGGGQGGGGAGGVPPIFGPGMPWNPGGGGGGGGGQGGGWGGGYRYRRGTTLVDDDLQRGHIPFAGAVGLGRTAGMLGRFGMGAIAGEVIEELATLPQSVAGAESGWLGNTSQARRFIGQTSAMGQAGGFNSGDLRDMLRANPALMRAGLGPDEGGAMLGSLGVVPRSAQLGDAVVNELGSARIRPGLSNIPPEMHTRILRDMLGVGATTLPNIDRADIELQNIMKQTARTGQDQLKVLQSIDTGVVTLSSNPGAATAISPTDLFRVNQQYANTPAGLAGVAGEQVVTATQRAWERSGTDPATTVVSTNLVGKLRNEGDLRNFFGADAWDKYASTPGGANALKSYLSDIGNNDLVGATNTLTKAFFADPTLAATDAAKDALTNNMVTRQFTPGGGNEAAAAARMANRPLGQIFSERPTGVAGWDANNPLNLTFAHQPGAGSKFLPGNSEQITLATFPSMAEGVSANIKQLQIYQGRGAQTVRQLMQAWNKNATEDHIQATARGMGVSPDTPVNMKDIGAAESYIRSAQPNETRFKLAESDITTGGEIAFGKAPGTNIPSYLPTVAQAKSDVVGTQEQYTLRQGERLNELNQQAWGLVSHAADALAYAIKAAVQGMATHPDSGNIGLPPH